MPNHCRVRMQTRPQANEDMHSTAHNNTHLLALGSTSLSSCRNKQTPSCCEVNTKTVKAPRHAHGVVPQQCVDARMPAAV